MLGAQEETRGRGQLAKAKAENTELRTQLQEF